MNIFELHFNPKKENHTFNTFIKEPENEIERKKGSLYMAGEITSPLLKPEEFLGKIASVIKKSFYSQKLNPEKSLSNTLKTANDFLGQEVKKENVGWLGNFNFAVLSIKEYNLVFAKTGDIRIILIRGGQISDIGKNLNLEGLDPYPVKVFFNVASGRLAQDDILLVLNKDIFEFIKERGILENIAKTPDISPKKIKQILPPSLFNKGEGSKISGFSLIFLFTKEKADTPLSMLLAKTETIKKHSIFPVPIIVRPIKETFAKFKNAIPKNKVNLPKIKNPFVVIKGQAVERFKKTSSFKKKVIPVAAFLALLLAGFIIFKTAEEKREKEVIAVFNSVEQKLKQAENLLLNKEEGLANDLLKQAIKELQPITQRDTSMMPSILSLKETVEGNLKRLNNVEALKEPEVVLSITDYDAEKIAVSAGSFYLYNNSGSVLKIAIKTQEKQTIELPDNVKRIDSSSGAVLINTEPGKVYYSNKGNWEGKEFTAGLFSSYLFNLYFIDKESCDIRKFAYLSNFNWAEPKIWHKDEFSKTCQDPISMAIDGSIWVLNQDSTITRYHTGEFQENLSLDTFPFPEEFTQIQVKNKLYILEPKNNRIIIAEKDGGVIKQYQSNSFDNLKGFAVSEDNKTIYLLNGSTIYKIEI